MSFDIKKMMFSALCASITVVFSQIVLPIPFTPIPISLGLLAVFITGGILPVKCAVLSQIIYTFLGVLGLPVFAGFAGGLGVISGPTGGFIIGYVFTVLIISFIINKFKQSKTVVFLSMVLGLLTCYACGVLGFMIYSHSSLISSITICVLPFVFGDLIKLCLGCWIVLKLRRYITI